MSVDPVTADGNTGSNFNRYKYAANNPYRFVDPDGRFERQHGSIGEKSPGFANSEAGAMTAASEGGESATPWKGGGGKSGGYERALSYTDFSGGGGGAGAAEAGKADSGVVGSSKQGYWTNVGDTYAQCLDDTTTAIDAVVDHPAVATATGVAGGAAVVNVPVVTPVVQRAGTLAALYELSNILSCGAVGLIAPIQYLQGSDD